MKFAVTLIFLALAPSLALAQSQTIKAKVYPLGTLIDAKPMNGAASTLTLTINDKARGYDYLNLFVSFTHAANGAITATCTVSDDDNATDFAPTTCTVTSGACALNFAGTFATTSLSADKNYAFEVGVGGYSDVQCVFSHGGTPGVGDIITVTGELYSKAAP